MVWADCTQSRQEQNDSDHRFHRRQLLWFFYDSDSPATQPIAAGLNVNPFRSVAGGQLAVDDDVLAFEADVLADGQVLEDPGHHFA